MSASINSRTFLEVYDKQNAGKFQLTPAPELKITIDDFIKIIEGNYTKWTTPIVTRISNRGATPFEVLVSTILSLRTKDQVTALASNRLFKVARTPKEIMALDNETLKKLIYPVGFYPTKTRQLQEISHIIIKEYGGNVPNELDELLKLPGVGRKTANLVLIEGFQKPAICVDTHVHRVSNRIGYVKTKTADKTEAALRKKLPLRHWIRFNEFLVAFGQSICKPISPFCSTCPVNRTCPKIGVTKCR